MKRRWMVFLLSAFVLLCAAGCGDATGPIRKYIEPTLEASYLGEFGTYIKETDADQAGAEELYASMKSYVSEALVFFASVNGDQITEGQQEELDRISAEILKKAKYSVGEITQVSEGKYQVAVKVTPLEFWSGMEAEIAGAVTEFNREAEGMDTADEAAEQTLEQAYTGRILAGAAKVVENMPYGEETEYVLPVTVTEKSRSVPQENWDELDDLILNIDYILDYFGIQS